MKANIWDNLSNVVTDQRFFSEWIIYEFELLWICRINTLKDLINRDDTRLVKKRVHLFSSMHFLVYQFYSVFDLLYI